MLELISMSILGMSYLFAVANEKNELEKQKEYDRIFDLKMKIFRYAVLNRLLYNDVVKRIQDETLSMDEIDKYLSTLGKEN